MNDELTSFYTQWKKSPSPATLTPLVTALDPLISKAMYSAGTPPTDSNVRTRARLHIASVLPRYDPTKAALPTFITNELKRLHRIVSQQKSAIPMPERVARDYYDLMDAERQLSDEIGQTPTASDLADLTGLSVKRITHLKTIYRNPLVSDVAVSGDGGVGIGATDTNPNEDLWRDAVYAGLDDTDKKILEWTTGYGGAPIKSKTAIAQKLGISSAAVSQRSAKIANKLQSGSSLAII